MIRRNYGYEVGSLKCTSHFGVYWIYLFFIKIRYNLSGEGFFEDMNLINMSLFIGISLIKKINNVLQIRLFEVSNK